MSKITYLSSLLFSSFAEESSACMRTARVKEPSLEKRSSLTFDTVVNNSILKHFMICSLTSSPKLTPKIINFKVQDMRTQEFQYYHFNTQKGQNRGYLHSTNDLFENNKEKILRLRY